jgi:hypothetical protein
MVLGGHEELAQDLGVGVHQRADRDDGSSGSRPEHCVLAHYGALADLDLRGFRVQDSPVHDPGLGPTATRPTKTAVGATYAEESIFGSTPRFLINIFDLPAR